MNQEEMPAEEPDIAMPPAPSPREIPPGTPPLPARRSRGLMVPLIVLVLLAIVAAGGFWAWQNPDMLPPGMRGLVASGGAGGGSGTTSNSDTASLRQQVQDLSDRVAKLEAAPTSTATPATGPSQTQPAAAAPSPDVKSLEARLAALEQRPVSAPAPTPAPPPPAPPPGVSPADLDELRSQLASDTQKFTALNLAVATLTSQQQGSDSQTAQKLQALQGRVDSTDKLTTQVSSLAARATKLTQVQSAGTALAAGKPLGTITDAPPALARFAAAPPPTEAALRLAYPDLAARSLAAAQPDSGQNPFLDRVWGRMQQAVTVRAGEKVIVGNPAAAILTRGQDLLDAGDLAGAVAALQKLPADAAAPLAAWMDQASALLAARAALADLAAKA